jgi:outer membrane protein assembly factor BamB
MIMRRLIQFALVLFWSLNLGAAEWPQWRGPKRDGHSEDTGLLKEWPASGPPLLWKTNGVGAGYSSVSVTGGRIYTMGDRPDSSFIHALDLHGKPVWSTKVGKPGGGGGYPGPRCTPTVDGERVYALGQHGDLVCVEAATGKEVWRKNLAKDFEGQVGGWGYSESPLVDGEQVICTPGGKQGTLLALNKKTGAKTWQSYQFTDHAEYASPIVAEIGGVRQYVQLTGDSVAGIAAETGKLLWRASRHGSTAIIPTPVFHQDHVYVASGYGVGCNLFRITSSGNSFKAEQVYANKVMDNHHGGVVLVGEHLYGYSDGRGWVCQNFKTGEMVWSEKKLGKGSIAYADERLYLRSEGSKGTVALIEATPDGYKEHGRFDQPNRSGKESWPHPVITGGKLYLRDQDLLLCYDVQSK